MSLSDFLTSYGLFVVELLTALLLLAGLVAFVAIIARRGGEPAGALSVEKLNDSFEQMRDAVNEVLLDRKHVRQARKTRKREDKRRSKQTEDARPRVYVIDFKGDLQASATASLRQEINAILAVASEGETVLLRLDNAGGIVHEHGLAASQLLRLKGGGLQLIAAVDKVAASGGYMMASVADRIMAAPFAIVGSIGVAVQLPNFHRLLESKGVDYEQVTAGRFKRTLTLFGENTDEARSKVKSEVEDIHLLFKALIAEHRPQIDLDAVATGEHWYGTKALELGLIDELKTSDEYLLERLTEADVYQFEYKRRRTLPERVSAAAQSLAGLWR